MDVFENLILVPTRYEAFSQSFFELHRNRWVEIIEDTYIESSTYFDDPPTNFELISQTEIQSVLLQNIGPQRRLKPDLGIRFKSGNKTLYCAIEIELGGSDHCIKQCYQYANYFMEIATETPLASLRLVWVPWVHVLSFRLKRKIAEGLIERGCNVIQLVAHPLLPEKHKYLHQIEPIEGSPFYYLAHAIRGTLPTEIFLSVLAKTQFRPLEKYIIAGYFYKYGGSKKMEDVKSKLSVNQLEILQEETIEKFPSHLVHLLSPEALEGLTPEQLEHLSPEQLKHLSPEQLKHLSPEQLKHLSPENIRNLGEKTKRKWLEILKESLNEP